MKSINALTFRKKFGQIIDEVSKSKNPVIIKRANKSLVVLMSYEQYQKQNNFQKRRQRLEVISNKINLWRKQFGGTKNEDSTTIIRKMRDNR